MLLLARRVCLCFVSSFPLFAVGQEPEFKSESELGAILNRGNAQSQSFNLATKNEWKRGRNKVTGRLAYLYTESGAEVSANAWLVGLRFDRFLDEKLSLFLGDTLEGNKFAGYRYRNGLDLGASYTVVENDQRSFLTELGYRLSYEKKLESAIPDSANFHYIRSFSEFNEKLSAGADFRLSLELLPEVTNFENLQINIEPSLSAALNNAFSIKMALAVRYDNVPSALGLERVDYFFTSALVAKF